MPSNKGKTKKVVIHPDNRSLDGGRESLSRRGENTSQGRARTFLKGGQEHLSRKHENISQGRARTSLEGGQKRNLKRMNGQIIK
jgi:hypothetical protein